MLRIITLPTPSLRQRSRDVDPTTLALESTQAFIRAMVPQMYVSDGIGLAAPQVGNNIRICVIGKAADQSLKDDLILVNPAWTKLSRKTNVDTEGCLSVPGVFGEVRRYTDITVTAQDQDGKRLQFDAHHFFARVIQHEVDHLDGILFIDRAKESYTVDKEKQEAFLRALKQDRANRLMQTS